MSDSYMRVKRWRYRHPQKSMYQQCKYQAKVFVTKFATRNQVLDLLQSYDEHHAT